MASVDCAQVMVLRWGHQGNPRLRARLRSVGYSAGDKVSAHSGRFCIPQHGFQFWDRLRLIWLGMVSGEGSWLEINRVAGLNLSLGICGKSSPPLPSPPPLCEWWSQHLVLWRKKTTTVGPCFRHVCVKEPMGWGGGGCLVDSCRHAVNISIIWWQ